MTQDQQAELLPCPFCGGEPILDAATIDDCDSEPEDQIPTAWCTGCSCTAFVGPWGTEAEAITAWNARATPKSSEGALLDEALTALQAMLDDWGEFRDVNGEEAASALAAKAVLAKAGKAQP